MIWQPTRLRIINVTNSKFVCGSWQCPLDEDANSHYVIIFPISILFGGSTKATPFPTAVFFLPTNMSSATRERQWGGRPAATRLVYTATTRVQLAPTPRLQTPKPTGKLGSLEHIHECVRVRSSTNSHMLQEETMHVSIPIGQRPSCDCSESAAV